MKLEKERLFNFKKINDPFPVMEIDNFLSKEEAQECVNILEKKNFDEFVNEGRKNIRMGTEKFSNILKEDNILLNIYKFFNDEKVFNIIYRDLEKISKKSKKKFTLINKPKYFKDSFFVYKKTIHGNNFIKKISNFLFKKFLKKISYFKDQFYFDITYSLALKGYKLNTHTDKKTRMIVFLLYLNELDDKGGDLEIYSQNKSSNKEFCIEKSFKPKVGKLIVFLSNPISFHNVSKIEKENTKRYFCYGSYTAKTDMEWQSE